MRGPQPFRVAGAGRLDAGRPVSFRFDGRALQGLEGDTLASALIANGIHLVGRSFKYHRPRGIFGAGSEEPNALVTVERDAARSTPNVRATVQELYDGLNARSQNRWPSLGFDLGALADRLSPLIAAGFYYKTFMWPRSAWARLYEPAIRAAAGLGEAPSLPDPDEYDQRYAHCEVLVAGGGPAGIAAALAAAETGVRVILADERAAFGGSLRADAGTLIDGRPGLEWAQAAIARLSAMPNVRLLPRTTVFGYHAQNMLSLAERVSEHLPDAAGLPRERQFSQPRERLWQIRAARVVLATGAIERPIPFEDNDRPGIMLASAGRLYLNHFGAAAGRRVALFTATDSGYRAAFDLARAGVEVTAIVDPRPADGGTLGRRAAEHGVRVMAGHHVVGTAGRLRLTALAAEPVGGGARRIVPADALLVSGGYRPSVHLFAQSRGSLRFDAAAGAHLPGEPAQACVCVGACGGMRDLSRAMVDATDAGRRAGADAGGRRVSIAMPQVAGAEPDGPAVRIALASPGRKVFIDLQNDVTAKDIGRATAEGMRSIEHIKRYTTNGMATDQGKTSNLNAALIAADALGRDPAEMGLTGFRAPFTPVTFGTLANHAMGATFEPVRHTPLHGMAERMGAVFEDVGQWKRARFFPRRGEDMAAAVARECVTVREAAGIFDASTLGKIEVVGPDAARFLDLIYASNIASLAPGRCRYGLMLREDGHVFDDGVVARLADDRFHLTTTTGGAAGVLNLMEDYLQTEFPQLRVWLTSITEQWAVIAVQGPRARDIVAPLVDGLDVSAGIMPHMSVRSGTIGGVPMRLFRVSFTGELGFEINVPASHAEAVMAMVQAQGEHHGACPYGTEAMHVLRAEKGYIIVGQETDGTVTADDVGLGRLVSRTKPDFVGIRGLRRPDLVAPGRPQLVGLLTDDPATVLEEGAHIVAGSGTTPSLGHVTSAYRSAVLGRSIALALVSDGRARMGETLAVAMPGRAIPARVVEPVFVDPAGERLHG